MITHSNNVWNNQFLSTHAAFWPLSPFAQTYTQSHTDWPNLDDYQQFFEAGIGKRYSASGAVLQFVEQGHKPERFEEGYEPRIYLKGEIQTRQRNWHDFFQVLVWRMMPNTKTIINLRHYQALKQRNKADPGCQQRSSVENALTQFDECGAVLLSSQPELLELVKNFRWKTLFWQHRSAVNDHLKCIVFGHAMYEKALNPYIGMTTHSVLLPVEKDFLNQPTANLVTETDDLLTNIFEKDGAINSPQDFFPFPLLGMPGWDLNNSDEAYYDNLNYFRPGRRVKT